jgi:outer membrane protein assembly factor BamB
MVSIRLLQGINIDSTFVVPGAGTDGTVQENKSTNCRHMRFPVVLGLFVLFLVSSFIFGPVTAAQGWMFRADPTHSGVYNDGGIRPTSMLLWTYTTGGGVISSPAVANRIVYVGSDDQKVYALNTTTGAPIWTYMTGGGVGSSPAVAKHGVVYVGSADKNVYALNAVNGAFLWNYTTEGAVGSSPAVADDVVYVGSADKNVYALNATTGAPIWTYTTLSEVRSSPAVADGVVYVGSWDDKVYALNASTGAFLWNYTTEGEVQSSPAVSNGVVYVGSYDHKVYALNSVTGALLWTYTTGGGVTSSPAVANGVVYVGTLDSKVYALDATTGVHIWTYPTGGGVWSSPAVANGVVYVGCRDSKVYAIGNCAPPTTSFTGTPVSGCAPLTVQFTDTSSGFPTAWNWDYKKTGSTSSWTHFSNTKNSSKTFTTAGTYSIRLNAINACGNDTETKNIYIRVYRGCSQVPDISTLKPSRCIHGSPGFILQVTGKNFVKGAKVRWNGVIKTTTFVSSTNLKATIRASDVKSKKRVVITVKNPGPGGGTSNTKLFQVT